jgi:putative molybdopterin biosynthesis protein
VVGVTLWHRQVGFLSRPETVPVTSFADVRLQKLRFINRQRGSGIRWLIDHRLEQEKIKPMRLKGYDTEVWTHWEVGLAVLRAQADAGVAAESVARLLGLNFQEIVEERFDLIVPKEHYFTKPSQALLAVLTSSEVKARATAIKGYNLRDSGRVMFPA